MSIVYLEVFMRKNKLYIALTIFAVIILFSTAAAISNQCGIKADGKPSLEDDKEVIAEEEESRKEIGEVETVEVPKGTVKEAAVEEKGHPAEGEITFETEDNIDISGNIFGSGSKWVILSHMFPTEQTSWFDFADYLADNGYIVLTYDFRGYGKSGGSKDISQIYKDLEAAVDFIRQYDIEKMFFIGASMGGTASIIVASKEETDGLVTISAPVEFKGLSTTGKVEKVKCPKLIIASKGDIPAADSADSLFKKFPKPKDIKIFDGSAHGTFIFDEEPENGKVLKQLIIDFLNSH